MKIQSLQNCSISELTSAFNHAFSDYILPIKWTEEAAVKKFKGDNIDLSLSPGYFVDGKLCGFIFHCIGFRDGQSVVWNGGTGVFPEHRGKGITSQLYQYILPALKKEGFQQTTLEVIEGNDPAIHIYKKMGFTVHRKLDCFKGSISDIPTLDLDFKEIDTIDWNAFQSLRSWSPTFQNDNQKIDILRSDMTVVGGYKKEELVGYIIFNKDPEGGDIYQFAVKENYRQSGIAKALFARAGKGKSVPLKIINVDARDKSTISFFEKLGFEKIISQFEMVRKI